MMQAYPLFHAPAGRDHRGALPREISEEILGLVRRVASLCDPAVGDPEVVVIIRRRPIDSQGRNGCRVEILCAGRMPQASLKTIRSAVEEQSHRGRVEPRPPGARTMTLQNVLMGGWKVTLDAKWVD